MGNCQTSELATAVIEHPSGRVERLYYSLTADQVMDANPGHYVAVIITTVPRRSVDNTSIGPVRYQKLLRPGDTLRIGGFYRLVSFEEVLKEFSSKNVRLSRMIFEHKGERRERRRRRSGRYDGSCEDATPVAPTPEEQQEDEEPLMGSGAPGGHTSSTGLLKSGQWRSTLQTIAEVGI